MTAYHFQLLDHGCGTAFRPTYDSLTLPFSSSAGRQRHICLDDWDSSTEWLFVCVVLYYKCSYLLTYLPLDLVPTRTLLYGCALGTGPKPQLTEAEQSATPTLQV